MRSEVTCVVGMHRSGTSAVAGLLGPLGVDLGPEERLMGPKVDNPRGFWEYEPFTDINDEILEVFGGSWDRPPELPRGWERSSALRDLRRRAREAIRTDFGRSRRWGFKDPRASLTLPFWQRLVRRMRYVVCVRHPLDVAASLAERNGLTTPASFDLWLRYTAAALAHTAGAPRLVVFYEDLLADRPPELRRLAAFLGVPRAAEDPATIDAANELVAPDLRHHAGADGEGDLPPAVRALHAVLRAHVGGQTPVPASALDALATAFAEASRRTPDGAGG